MMVLVSHFARIVGHFRGGGKIPPSNRDCTIAIEERSPTAIRLQSAFMPILKIFNFQNFSGKGEGARLWYVYGIRIP